jgi:hypothetical protein
MSAWKRLAWTILGIVAGAAVGIVAAVAALMVLGAVGFFENPDDMPLHRVWESVAVWWGGLLLGAVAGGVFAWRRTARHLELGPHRGSPFLYVLPVVVAAAAIARAVSMPRWICVSGSDNIVCTDKEFFRWAWGGSGTLLAIVVAFAVAIHRRRRRLPA